MRRRYRRDGAPYRLGEPKICEARFRSACYGCGVQLEPGAKIWWQPGTAHAFGVACGCGAERQASYDKAKAADEAARFDEEANATMHAM